MEKKHTGKIIGLMVLMFVSSYGGNIETLLQANVDYDKAGVYAFLYSLLGLCGSSLIAMAIPFVCRLIKGQKLSRKKGIFLCVVNSIIALVASAFLQEAFGILFVGGVGAIIYFFINKWLFVASKETVPTLEQPSDVQYSGATQMSLSYPDEQPKQYGNYAIRSEDVCLQQNETHHPVSTPVCAPPTVTTQPTPTPKEQVRYCSICGSRIDNNTKKCTGCGKQYFKGVSWPVVILSIIVFILAIALVFVITSSNHENTYNQTTPQTEAASTQTKPTVPKSTTPPAPTQPYYKRLGLTLNEYKIAEIVAYDVDEYCEYMAELKEIVEKGTYSDELKQERVIDSLNNNDYFEYGEKIILYRYLFPYDHEYNNDLIDYLNERDDVSYDEMEFVLIELGFAVFEDGTIQWD